MFLLREEEDRKGCYLRIFECYVHSLFFGNFLWYVLISSDIHARGTKVPIHIFIQWEDREIGVSFPDSIGFIRPDRSSNVLRQWL